MAIAAYASLLSLTHVLDNLHYRAPFHLPRLDVKLVKTLQDNVHFLLEFVELHSESKNSKIEGFWREMKEVAFEAEDKIDFHVVNQLEKISLGETSSDASISALCEDIEILISRTNFIKQELLSTKGKEMEDVRAQKQPRGFPPVARSSAASSSSKSVVVGIDEHVHRIMEELARDEPNLQILPIVGMGGIGKTTLAKTVFENPYIVEHFDRHIWLTISQEYSAEQILMNLLDKGGNKGSDKNLEKLGEELHKELFGRRYLIVMDDMWSANAWDQLRKFFPNNGNHSRIMVTTRLTKVADCLGSHGPYFLTPLDEDKSWDLLCLNSFSQVGCPHPELEEIGMKIVKSCGGLPLEITVIGRLLANSDMTREYWKFVANNIASFGNSGDDEHCLKILSLSYKSLPIHLKPCFLYMRTLHEDQFIDVGELIYLWISEGFIKSINDKSLEETGSGYAQDLIDRNLIFERESFSDRVGIHDLLRDLCIRESKKEEFFWSPRVQNLIDYCRAGMDCFLCAKRIKDEEGIQLPMVGSCSSSLQGNVFVCNGCRLKCMHSKFMRLVPTIDVRYRDSWIKLMQPTKVRLLLLESGPLKFLPPPLPNLVWNLQFMYIYVSAYQKDETAIILPREIWEMPQLRFIRVKPAALLPDPIAATNVEEKDFMILKNLQFLGNIKSFKFSKENLDRIPNLWRLHIMYKDIPFERERVVTNKKHFECLEWYSLRNLAGLQKLQVLRVQNSQENIGFSNSLEEIELIDCRMAWKDMSILGSLPRLVKLFLKRGMEGTEWNPVEGEFLRLKILDMRNVGLVRWTADETHFPILEHLRLYGLGSLEEVPLAIGDIPTLRVIKGKWCSGSVKNSVEKIREEQESFGNETLEVLFH